jgi:phosphosulfolactate phosphohydrolase-like enzyme
VVIDVRAFTTLAVLLSQHSSRVVCVDSIARGRQMASDWQDVVLVGESRGARPTGFTFGNSPSAIYAAGPGAEVAIFSSSKGTRELVRVAGFGTSTYAAAAVNARATAEHIRLRHAGERVQLITSGQDGEDEVCAQMIKNYLHTSAANAKLSARLVKQLALAKARGDDLFAKDVELCGRTDSIPIVMQVDSVGDGWASILRVEGHG